MFRICAAAFVAALLSVGSLLGAAPQPKPAEKKPAAAPAKPPSRQDVARSLDQEQKVYLQRLEFCTKLRQIAAETGDDELRRKADALEDQATEVYMQRTRTLPTILQDVKASESALETKRTAPPAGSATNTRPTTGRAPNGRPIVRE